MHTHTCHVLVCMYVILLLYCTALYYKIYGSEKNWFYFRCTIDVYVLPLTAELLQLHTLLQYIGNFNIKNMWIVFFLDYLS